ncbi:ABC transporter substrate-binding protein [Planotetraspora sp. A-T 1434]|uniref:ABC transporter substrate-binding protein n=1 Tax=Planotetraspora sp. A-T 1434 TaxID=2979219 RepID=UPI0021C1C720|nr:ABC transporter substrate-binding protein [Planotetraspora sp. A-T 1434]MCT9929609.1 ABC transporter substrate-binding protein [Planotetraspora sp. A-T 1434]
MSLIPLGPRRLAGAAAAVLLLGAAAACGSSGDAAPQPVATTAPLYKDLPGEQQKAGKVVVGSDISYAPMEYYDTDGTTVLGFDKELADALGKQLGVPFEFQNASFDGLITSLKANRIDVVMSGMSDTPERQQSVDFVDYYTAGAMLLVPKGNPDKLTALADLCGRTIAVQRATTQEGYAQKQSASCVQEGKQKIEILSFDRETEALLQVKQHRAVAGLEDYPVATYNARTSGGGGDFEVAGQQIEAGPLGMAVSKQDTALRDALKKALDALIANGEYKKLIDKWGIPAGALSAATVNGQPAGGGA